MAVILSGGTIKFDAKSGAFEATMPALGEGIGKLREALARKTPTSLGYGVHPFRVKLSQSEFMELMKFDPRLGEEGGVPACSHRNAVPNQPYDSGAGTVASRCRCDPETGRQPKKGGWQASIKKILVDTLTSIPIGDMALDLLGVPVLLRHAAAPQPLRVGV